MELQWTLIITGITMGLAFAAPPGAVTAETFRRGARGGFALAFNVQLGSLIGDMTYATLALAGVAALAQNALLQVALGAFGALFLLYLAFSSFASARTPAAVAVSGSQATGFHTDAAPLVPGERRSAFLSGMAISLANPWAIAFWLSLGGVLASILAENASASQMALFFASFMIGTIVWSFALVVFVGQMQRLMRPAMFRIISIVCGLALGGFGLIAASHVISLVLQSIL